MSAKANASAKANSNSDRIIVMKYTLKEFQAENQ